MNWEWQIVRFNIQALICQKSVDKIFALAILEIYHNYHEPRYDKIYREGVKWLDNL